MSPGNHLAPAHSDHSLVERLLIVVLELDFRLGLVDPEESLRPVGVRTPGLAPSHKGFQPGATLDLTKFMTKNQTMIKLNVHEVKAHLSEHLERLEKGEEDVVVICRRNEPIAELRALPRRRTTRRPILRKDPRFTMPKTFFDPLPASMIDDFEGGS